MVSFDRKESSIITPNSYGMLTEMLYSIGPKKLNFYCSLSSKEQTISIFNESIICKDLIPSNPQGISSVLSIELKLNKNMCFKMCANF